MNEAARKQLQRRLQMQIAAHMVASGIDHDTNGGSLGRFWNFTVKLSAVEERPATQVPVTFHCSAGVVGALVATKATSPIDDIALDAYRSLSSIAGVRLQEVHEPEPRVLVRADVAWVDSINSVFPLEVFTALWHAAVSSWIALDIRFPGRFELVEADSVPETRVLLLQPMNPETGAPVETEA